MASNTLLGVSPSATYPQILHIGTGSLAANSPVRLGDGTPTKLSLHASGIGIYDIKLSRKGTTARDVFFADAHGVIHPRLRAVLAANASNSTVTPTDLALTWEDSSTLLAGNYAIRGVFICQSAATTTGVRLRLDGPSAQTTVICGRWDQGTVQGADVNAWATAFATVSAPAITTPFLQTFEGIVSLSANALSAPAVFLYSEVAASLVEVFKGSYIEFVKL